MPNGELSGAPPSPRDERFHRREAPLEFVVGATQRSLRIHLQVAGPVDDRYIEPLGVLPDYVVRTGFRITPVVALISPGFTLRVDAAEVAEVFEMPLEIPCRPENFRPTRRVLHGVEVVLNDLNFEGRVIWGATAAILQTLCAALRGEA